MKARGGAIDVPLLLYFAFGERAARAPRKARARARSAFATLTRRRTPFSSRRAPSLGKRPGTSATTTTTSRQAALKAAGGSAGFPMTIAAAQLLVGSLYALFMWAAPDARATPKVTVDDVVKMIPVGLCAAGAHSASVFALGAGAVSFAQIVKAAEPAFAALVGTLIYGKTISKAKWLALIPVIGGVILASVKELDFAWSALFAACIANLFAAFKGNENKKLMDAPGIKDRLGNVGNQYALTTLISFLFTIPLIFAKGEAGKFGDFMSLFKTNPIVKANVLLSGLYFYGYNELATMTIKKTSAVTQSVANTAKRVIVIVGVAIVMKESLDPIKLLGCSIGIAASSSIRSSTSSCTASRRSAMAARRARGERDATERG